MAPICLPLPRNRIDATELDHIAGRRVMPAYTVYPLASNA
jgi:hypothetical protein